MELSTPTVKFDKKYKTVLEVDFEYDSSYLDIVYWLDENTNGGVDIKFVTESKNMFIGFENSDDALLFKIRFSK